MLQTIKKRQQEQGFTIIEVLIVLAIAGLIMLIVFLAVPALQRNSRNTQAKNSAGALLGGVSEFSNNNNGKLPTGLAASSGTEAVTTEVNGPSIYFGTSTADTLTSARIQGGYTAQLQATATAAGDGPGAGKFLVVVGFKCNTDSTIASVASARAAAVVYSLETSGGLTSRCVDS